MPDNSAFRGYRNDQIGIGNEGNTSQVKEPGLYFDPVSEKESEVFQVTSEYEKNRVFFLFGWAH